MPRRVALALIVMLAHPAPAQEPDPATPPESDGFSLMEEGARLLFQGLMSDMEPALNEMGKALDEMEPVLRDLGPQMAELVEMIGDFRNYEPPVQLPNGDILIRRKPEAPVPDAPDASGGIDL